MSRCRQIKTAIAVTIVVVDVQTTRQLKTDTQRMMQLQRQHVEKLQRQHIEKLQNREYQTSSPSNFSSLSSENPHIQTLASSSLLNRLSNRSSNHSSNQIRSLNQDDQLLSFELEELELQKEKEYENLKLLIKTSLRVNKKAI
jgi:hypothetical protein